MLLLRLVKSSEEKCLIHQCFLLQWMKPYDYTYTPNWHWISTPRSHLVLRVLLTFVRDHRKIAHTLVIPVDVLDEQRGWVRDEEPIPILGFVIIIGTWTRKQLKTWDLLPQVAGILGAFATFSILGLGRHNHSVTKLKEIDSSSWLEGKPLHWNNAAANTLGPIRSSSSLFSCGCRLKRDCLHYTDSAGRADGGATGAITALGSLQKENHSGRHERRVWLSSVSQMRCSAYSLANDEAQPEIMTTSNR